MVAREPYPLRRQAVLPRHDRAAVEPDGHRRVVGPMRTTRHPYRLSEGREVGKTQELDLHAVALEVLEGEGESAPRVRAQSGAAAASGHRQQQSLGGPR